MLALFIEFISDLQACMYAVKLTIIICHILRCFNECGLAIKQLRFIRQAGRQEVSNNIGYVK